MPNESGLKETQNRQEPTSLDQLYIIIIYMMFRENRTTYPHFIEN